MVTSTRGVPWVTLTIQNHFISTTVFQITKPGRTTDTLAGSL